MKMTNESVVRFEVCSQRKEKLIANAVPASKRSFATR